MKNAKTKNEEIKRKYFKWLTEAQGFSKSSIEVIEKALWDYEAFTKDEDYALFNQKRASGFKQWLSLKKHKDQPMSLSTQYTRLSKLMQFFRWLADQNGYKSQISIYDVSYLKMEKKQARMAVSPKVNSLDYPTLEQVKLICSSINPASEIDFRDKAMIAFALLSGMRDQAIISLPVGCFDPDRLFIDQDPTKGVGTKYSKWIPTFLLEFDDELLKVVLYWHHYLLNVRKFKPDEPFFPKTRVGHVSNTEYAFQANGVEPIYWSSTGSMRSIFEERCKKAGVEYFSPHKFRHAAFRLALDTARTAEQIKAVSQNLGHEHVSTTLLTYGRLAPDDVGKVIGKMNFKKKDSDTDRKLDEIMEILQK